MTYRPSNADPMVGVLRYYSCDPQVIADAERESAARRARIEAARIDAAGWPTRDAATAEEE